jgi:murein DD-endopeptidase MepM/ murein hydrolase activator NlpD
MPRITRVLTSSLAVVLVAGAIAPATANAWPLGRLFHTHPGASVDRDGRISARFYNKADWFQEVQVAGQVYTVRPHGTMAIKAPAGTPAYAAMDGLGHHKGDLLFALAPEQNGKTISFN